MISEEKAIQLAMEKLQNEGIEYIEGTAKTIYRKRKLPVGAENEGWVVSCDLNVSPSMEPNMIIVYISDPEGNIYTTIDVIGY